MSYIPQPKDITNFIGSGLSPQTYNSESMFRGPSLPQQQGLNSSTMQPPGLPSSSPMAPNSSMQMSQAPQQPMGMNPQILQMLMGQMGNRQPTLGANPMMGMLR